MNKKVCRLSIYNQQGKSQNGSDWTVIYEYEVMETPGWAGFQSTEVYERRLS
jgi:hypothetical protein